jgi:hypothetical protein
MPGEALPTEGEASWIDQLVGLAGLGVGRVSHPRGALRASGRRHSSNAYCGRGCLVGRDRYRSRRPAVRGSVRDGLSVEGRFGSGRGPTRRDRAPWRDRARGPRQARGPAPGPLDGDRARTRLRHAPAPERGVRAPRPQAREGRRGRRPGLLVRRQAAARRGQGRRGYRRAASGRLARGRDPQRGAERRPGPVPARRNRPGARDPLRACAGACDRRAPGGQGR